MGHMAASIHRRRWVQHALFPSGLIHARLDIEMDGPGDRAHIGWTVGSGLSTRDLALGCNPCVPLTSLESASVVELHAALLAARESLSPF
jgi:hypothetical protein